MSPTTETSEFIEYEAPGFKVRFTKTDPPVVTYEIDFSHTRYADKPQTWLALKALYDAAEVLT